MTDLSLEEYRKKSQQFNVVEQERAHSQRIYHALFDLIMIQDYRSISLQQIYKITEISRTTLYRRWASIDELLLDAIADQVEHNIVIDEGVPAHDSLKMMLKGLAEFLQSSVGRAFLQASLAIRSEVSLEKRDMLWQTRYAQIYQVFQRLVSEGKTVQISDDLISMVLGSFYFHIFIKNMRVDDAFIESIYNKTLILLQNQVER